MARTRRLPLTVAVQPSQQRNKLHGPMPISIVTGFQNSFSASQLNIMWSQIMYVPKIICAMPVI